LGHNNSVLTNHGELRTALLAEFTAAAEAARQAATKVDHVAATAVHDYRKALRRARAVLSMLGDALPKSERRAVKGALQEARRAVSTARDQTVAPEALAQLPLGEADRATADAVLANAKTAMAPTVEIKQLLTDGAARAAAQAEALQAAVPASLDWRHIADSIGTVYGDARRSRLAGKKSRSAFHTWRRRSKELAYQLEWVAGHAGQRLLDLFSEIDGVTSALGPAVDLIMLREFVATHSQGVTTEAIEHLTTAIDAQLGDLMKVGRKSGKAAFEDSGKQFAKRLRRSVRKDLQPAEPADAADSHDSHDDATAAS
jgi:CHAD domain-containing protein